MISSASGLATRLDRCVFVTLAERGIVGLGANGEVEHIPSLPLRGPIDVVAPATRSPRTWPQPWPRVHRDVRPSRSPRSPRHTSSTSSEPPEPPASRTSPGCSTSSQGHAMWRKVLARADEKDPLTPCDRRIKYPAQASPRC